MKNGISTNLVPEARLKYRTKHYIPRIALSYNKTLDFLTKIEQVCYIQPEIPEIFLGTAMLHGQELICECA